MPRPYETNAPAVDGPPPPRPSKNNRPPVQPTPPGENVADVEDVNPLMQMGRQK